MVTYVKTKMAVALLLVMFAAFIAPFAKTARAATDPVISVVPQDIDWNGKSIGDAFTVEITIMSPDVAIWSGQIGITYSPLVLECTGFAKGSAIDQSWLWVPGTVNNEAGYVTYSGWSCVAGQEPGWAGSGTFMTFSFKIIGSGTSVLDLTVLTTEPDAFYRTKLNKNEGGSIAEIPSLAINDGNPSNNQPPQPPPPPPPEPKHDVAIKSIKCFRASAYVGEPVDLEVLVENKGDFTEDFDVALYADKNREVMFDEYVVGIVHVTGLEPKTTKAVPFSWDTWNVQIGSYLFSARLSIPSDAKTEDNVLIGGAYLGGICNYPGVRVFDLAGALFQIGTSASTIVIAVAICFGIFKLLMSDNWLATFPNRQVRRALSTPHLHKKGA